jgi:hypothetical protein
MKNIYKFGYHVQKILALLFSQFEFWLLKINCKKFTPYFWILDFTFWLSFFYVKKGKAYQSAF